MSIESRTNSHKIIRGGRLIKWKGKAASLSPCLLSLSASVSMASLAVGLGFGIANAGSCDANFVCSGGDDPLNDTTQIITFTATSPAEAVTMPGFGINTNYDASTAIFLTSDSVDIVFDDQYQSFIAAWEQGIEVSNTGSGSTTITTTGEVFTYFGIAINAVNDTLTSDLTINTADTSGDTAIRAVNNGTGALTITSTGYADGGFSGDGIHAKNYAGTETTITATQAYGYMSGIDAYHSGQGSLTITSTGFSNGFYAYGIHAVNNSTDIGDLIIQANDTEGGITGISASQMSMGNLSITSDGTAFGKQNVGIDAFGGPSADNLSITSNETYGSSYGIRATLLGLGNLEITANGDTTASDGKGIYATNSSYAVDITIAATNVQGYDYGIDARNNGTGALTITTTGDVSGSASTSYYSYSGYGYDEYGEYYTYTVYRA